MKNDLFQFRMAYLQAITARWANIKNPKVSNFVSPKNGENGFDKFLTKYLNDPKMVYEEKFNKLALLAPFGFEDQWR